MRTLARWQMLPAPFWWLRKNTCSVPLMLFLARRATGPGPALSWWRATHSQASRCHTAFCLQNITCFCYLLWVSAKPNSNTQIEVIIFPSPIPFQPHLLFYLPFYLFNKNFFSTTLYPVLYRSLGSLLKAPLTNKTLLSSSTSLSLPALTSSQQPRPAEPTSQKTPSWWYCSPLHPHPRSPIRALFHGWIQPGIFESLDTRGVIHRSNLAAEVSPGNWLDTQNLTTESAF